MHTDQISVNAIATELENIVIKFEQQHSRGLLILPNSYRNLASKIAVRLCAVSDNCGLIGYKLHNPSRGTQLHMLFELDEINAVYGDVYLVDMGSYNNRHGIDQSALYASGFGKHRIFKFKAITQEQTQHE